MSPSLYQLAICWMKNHPPPLRGKKKLRLCGLEGAHGPKNAKDDRRWSQTLQDLWIFDGFQMKLHWFWILIMALGQVPCPSHPLQSTESPRPWSPSCCDSNFLEPSWPDVGAWSLEQPGVHPFFRDRIGDRKFRNMKNDLGCVWKVGIYPQSMTILMWKMMRRWVPDHSIERLNACEYLAKGAVQNPKFLGQYMA